MKCKVCSGAGVIQGNAPGLVSCCPACDGTGEYEPLVDIIVPPFTDGQKKLIEMTEKLAEKRGEKICDVDDDITDIKELLNDTIKRIENPTNEDWFCSLSTADKAKWLSQRSQILYDCGQRDVFPKIMYEEDWGWWLKQPHTIKE